jgi:hypothetical protein
MPLFIDGPPAGLEDLTNEDSGLLEVCRVAQIDLTVKMNLAHSEIGLQVEGLFEQQRSLYEPWYTHPKLSRRNLAVTPCLKRWHIYQTLSLVYRDVYFNQLNDRFQAKWLEYQRLTDVERDRIRELGVGVVLDPIARPCSPSLTAIAAPETGGDFYVSVSLFNGAGEESAPSAVIPFQLAAGYAISIQLTSSPRNAGGWNVYVGQTPVTLWLQNQTPLSPDETFLFYPSGAVISGTRPGQGQAPGFMLTLPRRISRG